MRSRCLPLIPLLAALGAPALAADEFKKALQEGEFNFDLRYRYEGVDQDGFGEDARASTLRLRLGYKTGSVRDLFGFVEFEALTTVGADDYNSTANGRTMFPVVADPEDEEVNQAFLGYTGLRETTFRMGRQRIVLDNERFVGPVGWRQLEQTFDVYSAQANLPYDGKLFVGHLTNVNRVNGGNNPDPAKANTNLTGELVNVSYPLPFGTVTAYGYFLEFEDLPMTSHRSLGVRFAGRKEISERIDLLYTAEYADQGDYKDGASTIDASYRLAELGVAISDFTIQASRELLGGDGTWAFQTPLATLHAFNGWADKFVAATPLTGLVDTFLSVGMKTGRWKCLAVYHDFTSDTGGIDYGTEIDLLLTQSFGEVYSWGLKYASYEADMLSTDTDKIWGWFQIRM